MTDVVRFEYRSARVKLVEEGIKKGPEKVSYMVQFSTAVSPSNGNVIYSIGQINKITDSADGTNTIDAAAPVGISDLELTHETASGSSGPKARSSAELAPDSLLYELISNTAGQKSQKMRQDPDKKIRWFFHTI